MVPHCLVRCRGLDFACRRITGSPAGRAENHAAPLCGSLQPTASPISPRQQDAPAGAEGLAQTEARPVQKKLPNHLPGGDNQARSDVCGLKKPPLTLSKALETYWDFAADMTQGKSPGQIWRWRNPRIKSFKNLNDVIGDSPLTDISADDLVDALKHTQLTPADEPVVDCLVRPATYRNIAPAQPAAEDKDNAAENPPIIHARTPCDRGKNGEIGAILASESRNISVMAARP